MTNSLVKKSLVKKLRKSKAGFTLIELIVVIAILGILAAILIPTVTGYINGAKQGVANADAKTVFMAAAAYMANNQNTTFTSYVSTNTTGTDAIIGGSELEQYLGTQHKSFTTANITMPFDANGKITEVDVVEGSVTGKYNP